MEIAMIRVRDAKFRDPVQVGGITAPGRVSWRDEDGPCTVEGNDLKLPEDTYVPMSNVLWYRIIPWVERIDVTEQAATSPEKAAGPAPVVTQHATGSGAPYVSPAPGKGKKR